MQLASVFRRGLLDGKVALVTGGGSGIGLRTARELAYLGATVVIASRNEERLRQAAEKIKAEGGKCFPVQCNIRSAESVRACVSKSLELAGGIDLLVNNAGGQFPSPAAAISPRGWTAVIETNLTGTFLVSQAVFDLAFSAQRQGAIVNVIANMFNGFPAMAHTGAARAGVDNLTKTLAIEWASHGVRVNSVAPGVIKSSGLDSYDPKFQEVVSGAIKHNYAHRFGTEAEVAAAIVFLLSPAAAFISGHTLRVDGGESIFHPLLPPSDHGALPAWEDDAPRGRL